MRPPTAPELFEAPLAPATGPLPDPALVDPATPTAEAAATLRCAMARTHRYELTVRWTGDTGSGTSGYRRYRRDHEVLASGKPPILGSADPAFRGDPQRWNPEELLLAALSQCHMLWYLHLASVAGVVVVSYEDTPEGTMTEHSDGSGEFTEVVLRPAVTVADPDMVEPAGPLHGQAHRYCYIARSVAFPVRHDPRITAR